MSISLARKQALLALVAVGVLLAPAAFTPYPSLTAAVSGTATPVAQATPTSSAATVAVPANWQTVPATSGLTTLYLPRQVDSGAHLVVLVKSLPRALVQLTLTFPDGSTRSERRWTNKETGYARFSLAITYQPQGSAEALTVLAEAILRASDLDDVVRTSVSILPSLQAQIKAEIVGRWLGLQVTCNQPGARVRFILVYPDGEQEVKEGGVIPANGTLTRRYALSIGKSATGTLQITAQISYNGVVIRHTGRVDLRARGVLSVF
ncbi:MAG TPA: hypothetical protein VFE42_04500 [Chloroflexota bacterium]|nr:hypothetical protein [Chloroflexota bacterium]